MTKKTELVFVPTPAMGHLLSAVELSKLIHHRHPNISILILIMNPRYDSSIIKDYVDSCQSRDSRLTFITLPPLPDSTSNDLHHFNNLIDLHKPLVKRVVDDRVRAGSPKPAAFILDMFCTPLMDVAHQLNVPSYMFFASGASTLCMAFHLQSLAHDRGIDVSTRFSDPDVELDNVPGFENRVPSKVVPGVLLDKELGFLNHVVKFKQSKGILVNTFTELESRAMEAFVDLQNKGKAPPVYSVGPMLELDRKSLNGGSKKEEEEDDIMQWLDKQPESSVVLLCFGSKGYFNEDQVKEIANGLDGSGYRFLWSLRRPPSDFNLGMPIETDTFLESLPKGFLDRTADRGKIIGWAPQIKVLAHRAIGGFLSHCGWNSTLESLWFGVPMATWPLSAEQQLNAFELVKELGVAVEIRMDYKWDWHKKNGNFLVMAEEIENGVKKLMSMDEETKEKVRKMGELGKRALEEGGSSLQKLDCFIADVLDHDSI